MNLIIQKINTEWTKKSRGMPNAAIRNSVPEKLELPIISFQFTPKAYHIHEVSHYEKDEFEPITKTWSNKISDKIDIYRIEIETETLEDGIIIIRKADVHPFKRKIYFKLKANQIGQIKYNWRDACWDTGEWVYGKEIINIGFVEIPSSDIFLSGKFDHVKNLIRNFRRPTEIRENKFKKKKI